MQFFRRLFCQHEFDFVRNIHGDEIIECGWKRSIWKCRKCGKINLGDLLHESPNAELRCAPSGASNERSEWP